MSKYKFVDQARREKPKPTIHPIWRGVGFLMMVLIPVVSYSLTEVLILQNSQKNWVPLPYDLMAKPTDLFWAGDPLLYVKIISTLFFALFFFALFTLITSIVNRAFGGPRYGPYDVPPIEGKVRKKAR